MVPVQANTSVTISSVFGNVQVNPEITNVTTSGTSLTTITGLSFYAPQISVSATVNPLGNLYVNTVSLAQASTSVSVAVYLVMFK